MTSAIIIGEHVKKMKAYIWPFKYEANNHLKIMYLGASGASAGYCKLCSLKRILAKVR